MEQATSCLPSELNVWFTFSTNESHRKPATLVTALSTCLYKLIIFNSKISFPRQYICKSSFGTERLKHIWQASISSPRGRNIHCTELPVIIRRSLKRRNSKSLVKERLVQRLSLNWSPIWVERSEVICALNSASSSEIFDPLNFILPHDTVHPM